MFKKKNKKEKIVKEKPKSPLEVFFSLGDKVTRGDEVRKANFNYYMLWIMFAAFSTILFSSFFSFLGLVRIDFIASLKYLGWSGVMMAILWFQYHGLIGAWTMKKNLSNLKSKTEIIPKTELTEDTVEEMLEEFKE